MEKELKVGDLIPFKQSTYDNAILVMKALADLQTQYRDLKTNDPGELERIKREFLGHMYHFASVFAHIKCYKSDSHTYLSDVRKRFKAEAIELLMTPEGGGHRITAAESLVYSSKYFTERVELTENIKAFFIKADLLNDIYQSTFQAIVQSLSGAKKEAENSKKDN